MSFELNVSPETFDRNKSYSLHGHIWVEVDELSFPSAAWDDFPVVILGWWLENVADLVSGRKTKGQCLFMDGPFYFEITAEDKDYWLLEFFKRAWKQQDQRILEIHIDAQLIVAQLLSAANTVIRVCLQKKWHSSDLDTLETQYSRLAKMIRQTS